MVGKSKRVASRKTGTSKSKSKAGKASKASKASRTKKPAAPRAGAPARGKPTTKKAPAKKVAVKKAVQASRAMAPKTPGKGMSAGKGRSRAGSLPRKPRPGVAPTTAARAAGRAGVDRARKPGAALRKRAIGKGAVAIGGTGRKTTPAARPSAAALRPSRPARSPAAARPGPAAAARTAGAPSAARPAAAPRGRTRAPRAGAVAGVVVKGKTGPRYAEILSPGALSFLAGLHRQFDGRRRGLLAARAERQRRFDAGELPDFLPETRNIRAGDWKVGPIPKDLTDRRVEITGPVDRKMIVNALNCGATHFMADFEDANSPTWANNIEGQINLKDRWEGKIAFTDDASGKRYQLGPNPAVLIVRPRGWHLVEEHLTVDGEPISGALFDFGLYFFHNVKNLLARGTGPYFYLPKMESHREARLWNDVFVHAQDKLGIPRGTIKVTVLIETLPAAFEMDEILYELREHAAGLNAGRWDYIFSFIKKFAKRGDYVLPDRGQVVMGKAFLGAYAALLIKTCHRRRAFAMGGMAAQIPIKGDPAANEAAFAKVRADKEREVRDGHDGTWVAHPDLVPVAKAVFDRLMRQPNQLDRLREDVRVTQKDLLEIHQGTKTEEGFRLNIRVGVQYIEAWLRGRGAVPIYNLMEDAATAEISRAQIWQWLRYGAVLDNGVKVTPDFFKRALGEEMERVKGEIGAAEFAAGRFPEAIELFRKLSLAPEFEDFLTIPAYKLIV